MSASSPGMLHIRELSRGSLRRQMQRWRSRRWLSLGSVNLDESQNAEDFRPNWKRRTARALGIGVFLGALTLIAIILTDIIRLAPCLSSKGSCISLTLAEFEKVCDFSIMPVRLTTTAMLPPLYAKLEILSADIEVREPGVPQPLAISSFNSSGALTSLTLRGGVQNITVDSTLFVRNDTGLALVMSRLLNEIDFQLPIKALLRIIVHLPIPIRIPMPVHTDMFLSCGHLPCSSPPCKYICQFGDWPLKDPEPSVPTSYVTKINKLQLTHDEEGQYVIRPEVLVWLTSFKSTAIFPDFIVDLYFFNHTNPHNGLPGFRDRQDLRPGNKLFRVHIQPFVLRSLEAGGGQPFAISMTLRLYNQSLEQAQTAADLTTRFLAKDPCYVYLAAVNDDPYCPSLRDALLTVPPAGMALNSNSSRRDRSDSSLSSFDSLSNLFTVNSFDLFSLNNRQLRSFVNLTLELPFALEGELPGLAMEGISGNESIAHFRSFPAYINPPPEPHLDGNQTSSRALDDAGGLFRGSEASITSMTIVLFTEIELNDWGLQQLETIFPDTLTQLRELDIQLIGSPASPGNVLQTFLTNVSVQLSSISTNLVTSTPWTQSRIFYVPPGSDIKPRIHLEVRPVTFERNQGEGVLVVARISYAQAFQGLFDIRAGPMHFSVANEEDFTLASVTVSESMLSRDMSEIGAEILIADNQQAEAVHALLESLGSPDTATYVKLMDGVIDSPARLKEIVPLPLDEIQHRCSAEIQAVCPGVPETQLRECLNAAIGKSSFSHDCLLTMLPVGSLDLHLPDLRRLVGMGRGIATGLLEEVRSTVSRVTVNLIEILRFHTPNAPLDLQLVLLENSTDTPSGSQVEVVARTNVSLGIFDLVDLTYVVPPLSIAIAAPLNAEQEARNHTSKLFTFTVPTMNKSSVAGPILVESTVQIENIYQSTSWLEAVLSDLKGKYIVVQPLAKGDAWSYMAQPIKLKVDILTAINSTQPRELDPHAPVSMLQDSNETWSKIFFKASGDSEVIMTETSLAFSRPWSEAIDIKVLPVCMAVYVDLVEADDTSTNLLNAGRNCSNQANDCHLGYFQAPTFRTERGQLVTIDTYLNLTSQDDGELWGHLLSDYVSGARVGLSFRTSAQCIANTRGRRSGPFLDLDAAIIMPKLPPLNIPLNDVVHDVAHKASHRRLSLSEIWASLDPIILSVTQPVSVRVDSLQLTAFDSEPIDPLQLEAVALSVDLRARAIVTIPDIFEVDLEVPPLQMGVYASDARKATEPFAIISLSDFAFKSNIENATSPQGHIELLRLEQALNMTQDMLNGTSNMTLTLRGMRNSNSQALFTRVFSHMRLQLDMVNSTGSDNADTDTRANDTEQAQSPSGAYSLLDVNMLPSPWDLVFLTDLQVPQELSPVGFSLLAGNMDGDIVFQEGNNRSHTRHFGHVSSAPVILSPGRDINATVRLSVLQQDVGVVDALAQCFQHRQAFVLYFEGLVATEPIDINSTVMPRPTQPIRTGIVVTPQLMDRLHIYDSPEAAVNISLDNDTLPFSVDNVGIIGGDTYGSPVTFPCLLKGWCDDNPLETYQPHQGPIHLMLAVLGRFKGLPPSLGIPSSLSTSVHIPRLSFLVTSLPSTATLGIVSMGPFTLCTQAGSLLRETVDVSITNEAVLQDLADRLWQDPITVQVLSHDDGAEPSVLTQMLARFPILLNWAAPSDPTHRITTLLNLPTVCQKTWSIRSTNADNFTALVQLPSYLDLPISVHLPDFRATVSWQGQCVLEATTESGDLVLGPIGNPSTGNLLVSTVADSSLATACPYVTQTPHLCHSGEALGRIMTLGDSGPVAVQMQISFANLFEPATRRQVVNMPLCLFGIRSVQAAMDKQQREDADAQSMFARVDYTPPTPSHLRPLTCTAANEMIQDLYVNIQDTIESSLLFWKSVEVALKVYMVNIFAFPLMVSHMRLNMYFRDADGVPGDMRPMLTQYEPSYDYCLVHEAELATPGLQIPPGEGRWTPLLKPVLDESKLRETLSRLTDEVVINKRLCVDLLGSVIGVTIQGGNGEVPFQLDLPVSIRGIPFYSPHACNVPFSSKSTKNKQLEGGLGDEESASDTVHSALDEDEELIDTVTVAADGAVRPVPLSRR